VRWQQGYRLVEVMREWRHLHLCLVDELELDCVNYPDVPQEVRAIARRALARLSTDGLCESSAQYAQLQQTEAAGRVQDLEQVIARLNELKRQQAESWREAAHDLRGNLGVLKNVAHVLNHEGVREEDRVRSVRMLKSGVDSMHAFLNDLMTLSRLEAGHESKSVERFDAAAPLKELCNNMRGLATERRLFLAMEGPDEMPVEGDRVKVLRIAQNLLGNALNYTETGGVKVVWAIDETPGTDRWSLCVQDTGPGFQDGPVTPMAYALKEATDLEASAVDAQSVSEDSQAEPAPTMRSKSAGRPAGHGEGIGLSIVKRLCELLDASLELQTEPGKGTTFRVMFPLRYSDS
jgi:signal transduction histidine kinase